MGDIFDQLNPQAAGKGDIFDQVAAVHKAAVTPQTFPPPQTMLQALGQRFTPDASTLPNMLGAAGDFLKGMITGIPSAMHAGMQDSLRTLNDPQAGKMDKLGAIGDLLTPQGMLARGGGRLPGQAIIQQAQQTAHPAGKAFLYGTAALPIVGPALASIYSKADTGNNAGAATEGALDVAALRSAMKPAVPAAVSPTASHLVNRMIQADPEDFAYGRNPGEELIRQNLLDSTKQGMLTKIQGKLGDVGQQLNKIVQNAKGSINPSSIINGVLDKLVASARNGGKAEIADALENFRSNFNTPSSAGYRTSVTPAEALQLKRDVGANIFASADPLQLSRNGAARKIYHELNQEIGRQVPESVPLNETEANLIAAQRALRGTVTGQYAGGGPNFVHSATGAVNAASRLAPVTKTLVKGFQSSPAELLRYLNSSALIDQGQR